MLANQLFSLDLHTEWLATLQELKSALATLDTHTSFPMTQKFHIITEHCGKWVERQGRSLRKGVGAGRRVPAPPLEDPAAGARGG